MGTPAQHIMQAQVALQDAQRELVMQHKEPTPTTIKLYPKSMLITSGSSGVEIDGLSHPVRLFDHDVIVIPHHGDEAEQNLVALRTSLSECIRQRDEARTQVENLQEFNDNQRKQLESLQKEMAAIHMLVTAESRTKLDDAAAMHGSELPFLLRTVYEAMTRYFNTKNRLSRLQEVVDKFTKEVK